MQRMLRGWVVAILVWMGSTHGALAANVADLGVRLNGPNVRNGEVAEFHVYVANAGPTATNDLITVTLTLPDSFSFVSGGGNDFACTPNGQQVVCLRSTPLPQGSADFPVRLNVCTSAARVSIGITIDYSADNNLASNRESRGASVRPGVCRSVPTPTRPTVPGTATPTATVTPASAPAYTDLAIGLIRASTFRAGGIGAYAVAVGNNGPESTNQPIVVTDNLPSGMTLASSSGSGWSCISTGQTVRCTFGGSLGVGETTSFQLNVRVARSTAPSVTNVVTMEYVGDVDSANNFAGRPTTIRR